MTIGKLASAIRNDVLSGLRGYHNNLSLNLEQLEDEIVITRLELLKQYSIQGILPINDLVRSINCIDVDCKSLDRCTCKESTTKPVAHFEIPQVIADYGKRAFTYVGSIDRKHPFNVVTSLTEVNTLPYRKRGSNKPYVWIDFTPNENGMLDCFVFNAPFLEQVSVVAVFKDPRQLHQYSCCVEDEIDDFSFIDGAIKEKLTKEKINYYRQLQSPNKPNTQTYE